MISCKIIPLQLFQEISNGENNLLFKRRNKKLTNQKQELHVVAMFANRSGRNEQSS
jgi:hypothetical protein